MRSLRRFVPGPLRALRRHLIALCELPDLRRRLADLEVFGEQLGTLISESGVALPPPRELQVRVVGVYAGSFLQSGHQVLADMEAVLGAHGLTLAGFPRILDFGCGCGRVLRCLGGRPESDQELYGTDIDGEAIGWCQSHYGSLARFSVNAADPPLEFPADFFDFVYSISIFTHLPEAMQFAWLHELQRVVKPGAHLLLSFHGEKHYDRIPKRERERLRRDGFVYLETGQTAGLPGFYQTAWHSAEYIRQRWGEVFEVLDIVPAAIENHQDAVLCRRRPMV
jgi:SAM-dependent methyltransferase